MTIPLEHIQEGDWAAVNRVTDALRGLVLDTGGQSLGIRIGASSVTWAAAGVASNVKTVTHGLGKTPVVVGAWGSDSSASQLFYLYPFTFTSTQFSVEAVAQAAPGAVTKTFTWVVLG